MDLATTTNSILTMLSSGNFLSSLISTGISTFAAGFALWYIGSKESKKKQQADAIRDLMTYRGDFASSDFRRSLNKVAITFHDQAEIREEVRDLYDVINTSQTSEKTKRAIVGLIYKLCQKNGFKGLTEYDIDQSFVEKTQTPDSTGDIPLPLSPAVNPPATQGSPVPSPLNTPGESL